MRRACTALQTCARDDLRRSAGVLRARWRRLPLLWWLLRVTPPAPRSEIFPAIRLLLGLHATEETPARTPWWLLLLRLVAAALVIVALARPVLDAGFASPAEGRCCW